MTPIAALGAAFLNYRLTELKLRLLVVGLGVLTLWTWMSQFRYIEQRQTNISRVAHIEYQ